MCQCGSAFGRTLLARAARAQRIRAPHAEGREAAVSPSVRTPIDARLTALGASPRIDGMNSREPRSTASPWARAAAPGSACLALLALAFSVVVASAAEKDSALYQWTDERGNVRYTPDPDRVPSSRRGTLLRLEPGMPPPPAPIRPAAAPAPVPGEPAPAATTPARGAPAAAAATPAPSAPAAAPQPPPAPGAGDVAREQQLAAAIAADQEALKVLIAAQPAPGDAPLAESAQLREIAQRLPQLQAELHALRERRTPPAGP
jgi:hypothetical protein